MLIKQNRKPQTAFCHGLLLINTVMVSSVKVILISCRKQKMLTATKNYLKKFYRENFKRRSSKIFLNPDSGISIILIMPFIDNFKSQYTMKNQYKIFVMKS